MVEYLYHYTSLVQFTQIMESGFINLTCSNLLPPDNATLELRKSSNGILTWWDKNMEYKPVVWLTSEEYPIATDLGLTDNKCEIRLTIRNCFMYQSWKSFADSNNMDPEWRASIEEGRKPETWYISTQRIPVSAIVAVHQVDLA